MTSEKNKSLGHFTREDMEKMKNMNIRQREAYKKLVEQNRINKQKKKAW